MRNSAGIIGLKVFSVIEGQEVGEIRELLINPDEGAVQFLLVDTGKWYLGARVLAFDDVLGIGQDAVTTESEAKLIPFSECETARALMDRGVSIYDTKLLSREGSFVGIVTEYSVDEKSGKIIELEFENTTGNKDTIPAGQILTFGSQVIVVDHKKEAAGGESQGKSADTETKKDATRLFVERQKKFLLGKTVTRDIRDEQGKLIISEGTLVDEKVLETAEQAGKMVELSENTK